MGENEGSKQTPEGVIEGDRVIITDKEGAELLSQGGYGVRKEGGTLSLYPWEALYLVAERRMKILMSKTYEDSHESLTCDVEAMFRNILHFFQEKDAELWTKYLIYRDLRSRGYVVRGGLTEDIGFRVYDKGDYPDKAAKYVVFPIREGSPVKVERLMKILKVVQGVKKKLIAAVMDRRGEVVYYSVSQFNLQ